MLGLNKHFAAGTIFLMKVKWQKFVCTVALS